MKVLVERKLVLQKPDGLKTPVLVSIGMPYWVKKGKEAACPIRLEGLYHALSDIRGVDPYQALELAMQLANTLLAAASSTRQRLLWPDGKRYEVALTPSSRAAKKRGSGKKRRIKRDDL